jgi:predicted ABC-type transport system involved in lysophospholipase L1 biosynthesis ATPase subunit
MAWNWYQIKAVADTMKNSVPDETLEVELQDIGTEIIRFINGFSVGIIFKGFLLFPNMNARNPFTQKDEVGAMIKDGYYWVGINMAS